MNNKTNISKTISITFIILFSIISGIMTYNRKGDIYDIYTLIPFVLIAVYVSMNYLQSGKRKNSEDDEDIKKSLYQKTSMSDDERFLLLNKKVQQDLTFLNKKIDSLSSGIKISEEDRNQFIISTSKNITDEAISLAFKEEADKLSKSLSDRLKVDVITEDSLHIASRLRREIKDLRLRSNFNLVIGMVITVAGLFFLWNNSLTIESGDLFVPSINSEVSLAQHDKAMFIILSRISIVILIEVFAYFFLRLYKQAIVEIKNVQNELTNLESKLAAVKFSIISECKESIKSSLLELSKTERNFILKKSQTSVELERAKSDNQITEKILKIIPDLVKRGKD